MNKKLLTLTALLLATATAPRGEGENPPTGSDGRLTEAEWRAKMQAEHAQTSHADLVAKLAAANAKIDTLTANQVPRGGRALTADEAKKYDAFVALGEPDDVKTKLEQGEKDGVELTDLKTQRAIDTAATDAGYKSSVLADRLKADGLTVLPSREVDRDGKKVKVPYVKDGTGAEHELHTYAKDKWGDYLLALTVTSGSATATGATVGGQQDATTTSGTGGSWVQQALAKSSQGGATYVDPLQPGAAAPAAK